MHHWLRKAWEHQAFGRKPVPFDAHHLMLKVIYHERSQMNALLARILETGIEIEVLERKPGPLIMTSPC